MQKKRHNSVHESDYLTIKSIKWLDGQLSLNSPLVSASFFSIIIT